MSGGAGTDGRGTPAGHRSGPGPEAYREEVLPTMPALTGLYARAVGRSRTLVMSSRPLAAQGVPAVVLRVDGVRADPARLTAYQHLLGEPGTDELPAGYVHTLGFPLAMALMVRADFPLPVLGMVHVRNRVVQHRALRLGEALTLRAWAEALRPHQRGTQVDLVVSVGIGDDEVWRGTSTYLAKERAPKGGGGAGRPERTGSGASTAAPPVGAGEETAGARTAAPAPGPPAVAARWRLPADTGRRYAEVSGDRNPIHVSRLGARLFGFPRPIAHGMYTAARALAAVRRGAGALEWTAEFTKPVLLPGTVVLTLAPHGAREAADAGRGAAGTTAWAGTDYTLRDGRGERVHVAGSVRPL